MKIYLTFICCASLLNVAAGVEPNAPLPFQDKAPQLYNLTQRASEIDSRTQEHSEIDFLFKDAKGKVLDLQHATVDTRVAPQGKLVIWLMDYSPGLFERVASYGLHGIQVHYANRWFGKLKDIPADGLSIGKIRLEAATGEDHSSLVNIPRPDGMMERSLQFLKHLAKSHPQGKWEQFLNDQRDEVRWDKVVMSGISHGSTTAARFALHQKVDRIVMFSGPRDNTESWQSLPSATPTNRFFGFTHVFDGGWSADHYCRSWQMLGLHRYGPVVNVEQVDAPFHHSRRLITNFEINNDSKRAHTMVIPGGNSAKNKEGLFAHEAVWKYLFTHPVDQFGPAVDLDPTCQMELQK